MTEKKRTEPDWQDIRIFLALGRYGSLSAAARALSVNHATISRRIRSLEATLGERLVERRQDGYVLTPAGTRTLAAAGEMEAALQTLVRDQDDGLPSGLVRVNAPPGVSQGFLLAKLAELPARYPALDIDLATDLRAVSLERHVTDIAVRLGRPQDGDFIARRLGLIAYAFYGTPQACERVEQGAQPVLIGFDEANAYLPEAVWMAAHFPQTRVAFRANNHVGQAIAARSGVGLALLPHYVGRTEPALRLCRIEPVPPSREIWLLTRRQDKKDLRINAVVDFLTQIFADARALFEP